MTQNTENLSSSITGVYVTNPSVDTAFAVALRLIERNMEHNDLSFIDALTKLRYELRTYRFHTSIDECEEVGYQEENVESIDSLTGHRYNEQLEVDGEWYKFPSATAAQMFVMGWAAYRGEDDVNIIVGDYSEDFCKDLNGLVQCLSVNNGYGDVKYGGYWKRRFDDSFASTSRFAPYFFDGRSEADRADYWHRQFVDVALVAYLTFAMGITFPKQSPYNRNQNKAGGLSQYHEEFRTAFPEIAEALTIGKGKLSRIECLFTLPGHLVALYAIGEGGRVREEYARWQEASRLVDEVVEYRKEQAMILIAGLKRNENYFRLKHVSRGIGLYIETDEHIAKELWDCMKRPKNSEEWSQLQQTFHEMLSEYMNDVIDGKKIDAQTKREYATRVTHRMESESKSAINFIRTHVAEECIRDTLLCFITLHNMKPAVMVLRRSNGHCITLTNGYLDVKVDLRGVYTHLKSVEPHVWHFEGQELTKRFQNHMLMTSSGKVSDRKPSELSSGKIMDTLENHVGIIEKSNKKSQNVHTEATSASAQH